MNRAMPTRLLLGLIIFVAAGAIAIAGDVVVAIWVGFVALVLLVRFAGERVGRDTSPDAYRKRLRFEVFVIAAVGLATTVYGLLPITGLVGQQAGSDIVIGAILLLAAPLTVLVLRTGLRAAGRDDPKPQR